MAGDVMMVITGATVGRCAVFSASDEPGFVNQHVALCRLPQTEVDPDFVRWALLAPQGQEQLLGKRYGQGKPGLNLKNIRELTIPAAPLEEQKRIVERLDSTAERMIGLRSAMVAASDEFKSLLPSVLNQAFSGQL
jgi:type I restriction enzyme S subunit